MMDCFSGFGRFVAARRKEMKLTQEQLAERIGVSKSAIAKWETGGGFPDRDNLKRLSDVINISVDDLHGVMDGGVSDGKDVDINITADLIAVLESKGYKVIRPWERKDINIQRGDSHETGII